MEIQNSKIRKKDEKKQRKEWRSEIIIMKETEKYSYLESQTAVAISCLHYTSLGFACKRA